MNKNKAESDWTEFVSMHGNGELAFEMASSHEPGCDCVLCKVFAECETVRLDVEEAIRATVPKLPDWIVGQISREAARSHSRHFVV